MANAPPSKVLLVLLVLSPSCTMSWDATRRNVRSVEARLDSSLNQYSRLAVTISRSEQGAAAWPGSDVEEGRKGPGKGGEDALVQENAALEEEIKRMLSEVSALAGANEVGVRAADKLGSSRRACPS